MSENIVLKKHPKVEFQLFEKEFQLIDEQAERKSSRYSYSDLQSIELDKIWFPRLAKWLRAVTWIFNGVPFFPDAESYKKANLTLHFEKTKLGIWLTDTSMAREAKKIKKLLEEKVGSATV